MCVNSKKVPKVLILVTFYFYVVLSLFVNDVICTKNACPLNKTWVNARA